jgi:hypothetical protein
MLDVPSACSTRDLPFGCAYGLSRRNQSPPSTARHMLDTALVLGNHAIVKWGYAYMNGGIGVPSAGVHTLNSYWR